MLAGDAVDASVAFAVAPNVKAGDFCSEVPVALDRDAVFPKSVPKANGGFDSLLVSVF